MRKLIKTLFYLFFIPTLSFAAELIAEDIESPRDRGIDKMNFYIPTTKQNKYSSFIEPELRRDRNIYKWTMAEGYQILGSNWDIQYKIEREYHIEKKTKAKSHIWDNEIYFLRYHSPKNFLRKIFQHRTVFGLKYYEEKYLGNRDNQYYKFYIGQKFSSFFNLGMGGTYLEFETDINKVFGRKKDGYSLLASIRGTSNIGYGVQFSNILEYEYLNYNQYDNTHKTKWEAVLRWTYELNENIAFSPEAAFKVEKYDNSKEKYLIESSVGPYVLFTKNIDDDLRIYGKVGLPVYRKDKSKAEGYKYSKSQASTYSKIGFEYIF